MVDTRMAGAMSGTTTRRSVPSAVTPQLRDDSSKAASRLRKAGASSSTFTPRLVVRCTQMMPQKE